MILCKLAILDAHIRALKYRIKTRKGLGNFFLRGAMGGSSRVEKGGVLRFSPLLHVDIL